MEQTLKTPAFLKIQTPHGSAIGGSQMWYPGKWERTSGCGPTAASNMIWYLAQSRSELASLISFGTYDRDSFVRLQIEMFGFVTPTMRGVHNSDIFTRGIIQYGESHGVKLTTSVLAIPQFRRPSAEDVHNFVTEGLRGDCPVAFLNLSNGNQHQLDNWHWVTIIALDNSMSARICDQGKIIYVDLRQWLRTTMLGGALVFVQSKM